MLQRKQQRNLLHHQGFKPHNHNHRYSQISHQRKNICIKHSKSHFTPELAELQKQANFHRKKYYTRSDPNNYRKYKEAVEKFNALNTLLLQQSESDFYAGLDKSDPKLWSKLEKYRNDSDRPVIQPQIIKTTRKEGNQEISEEIVLHDDADINKIMISTHITRAELRADFDEEWHTSVEEEVTKINQRESEIVNFMAITDTYPSVRVEDVIPADFIQEVKEAINDPINQNLLLEEVKDSKRRMNMYSAPGPDGIHPIMVKKAGHAMDAALLDTFNTCWVEGTYPEIWKQEHRIYLPKPHKATYNIPKSYRSITLVSIIGKLYERIGNSRLSAFMEQNGLLSPFQYAYRKHRDLTQALLYYILDTQQSLEDNKVVMTTLVDLEGAYDCVW